MKWCAPTVVSCTTCGRAPDSSFISDVDMRRHFHTFVIALTVCIVTVADGAPAQAPEHRFAPGAPPITVRPSALAQVVSELAGSPVSVQRARILWVIDPHAIVIESDSIFDPTWRDRDRVLVLLERNRSLAIPRPPVAIAPVNVVGIARTLLGIQAAQDVPWPQALTRREIERLGIRAAILANSIRTSDGVELTSSTAAPPIAAPSTTTTAPSTTTTAP